MATTENTAPPTDDADEETAPVAAEPEGDEIELADDIDADDPVVIVAGDDDDDDDEEEEAEKPQAVVVAPVAPRPAPRPQPGRPPGAKEEPPPPYDIGERVILIQNTRPRTGTPIGDYAVGSIGRVETVLSQTAIVRFESAPDTKEVVAFTCLKSADKPEKKPDDEPAPTSAATSAPATDSAPNPAPEPAPG